MTHLVDTSAWIPFLRRDPALDWLGGLIELGSVGIHDFTVGELAMAGAPPVRFAGLPRVATAHHDAVLAAVALHRPRKLTWIDAHLVVAAQVARLRLVTADGGQAAFGAQMGVAVDRVKRD